MSMVLQKWFGAAALAAAALFVCQQGIAAEYTISGEFDGCEYGKLYELDGGQILECQTYTYFYEYRPRVIARGRDVVLIGDEEVDAYLHGGRVFTTHISDEFEGCDFDRQYSLDNGLVFSCMTYSYTYKYRPEVKIFVVEGGSPKVFIDGKEYSGVLLRTR